jgi:hypothetical protein
MRAVRRSVFVLVVTVLGTVAPSAVAGASSVIKPEQLVLADTVVRLPQKVVLASSVIRPPQEVVLASSVIRPPQQIVTS